MNPLKNGRQTSARMSSSVFVSLKRHWFPVCFLGIAVVVAFFDALAPINSYDFWWHLKTGDYIVEHRAIPDVDPFTFTATADDPDSPGRPAFILRQYWLAQILFSVVNGWFGLNGIIVLRGVVYAGILLLAGVFLHLRGALKPGAITFPLLILASRVALEDSDRPQNFAYLAAFAVFSLVEIAIVSGKKWLLYLNVPILLIAANMHGGFVVPLCFLLVYAAFAFCEERLRPCRRELLISSGVAAAATYLNPNGWAVFAFLAALPGSSVVKTTMEFQSPLKLLPFVLTNPGWISFGVLSVILVPSIVYLFRKRAHSFGTIALAVLLASLASMRFIYFMVPIAVVAASLFLAAAVKLKIRANMLALLVLFACSAVVLAQPWHQNRFGISRPLANEYFPEEAANFLATSNLSGNVYNFAPWGGFLQYQLWPELLFFSDTRLLVTEPSARSIRIAYGQSDWRSSFDEFNVAVVVMPSIDIYTGDIFPLVRGLAESEGWSLVHHDGVALVFARKGLLPVDISKTMVYFQVIRAASFWRPLFPFAPGYQRSLAEAYSRLGQGR